MNSECSRCFWTISSYSQKLTHDKDNSKKAFWVQPCCTESKDIQLSLWLCFASYSQGQWFLHRAGSFYLPSHRKAEWLWSTPGAAQLLVTRDLWQPHFWVPAGSHKLQVRLSYCWSHAPSDEEVSSISFIWGAGTGRYRQSDIDHQIWIAENNDTFTDICWTSSRNSGVPFLPQSHYFHWKSIF